MMTGKNSSGPKTEYLRALGRGLSSSDLGGDSNSETEKIKHPEAEHKSLN